MIFLPQTPKHGTYKRQPPHAAPDKDFNQLKWELRLLLHRFSFWPKHCPAGTDAHLSHLLPTIIKPAIEAGTLSLHQRTLRGSQHSNALVCVHAHTHLTHIKTRDHTFNSRVQETEAKDLCKFKVSLVYIAGLQ